MDEAASVSTPQGGPLFAPGLTTNLTSIPDFESAVFHELEELKAMLKPDSALSDSDVEEDISVDELKVFRDEELVQEGLKEALKEDGNSSGVVEHYTVNKARESLPESCVEKLKHLADIRERQKEDRAAAAALLHSLVASVPSKKSGKRATSSSENEKIKSLESAHTTTKIKPSNSGEYVGIRYPEVLLCIEVYDTSKRKSQEILVLGQQKLTELKDVIRCRTDKVMAKAELHDLSGYFLIEDVFFNDMRDPSAIDYSEPILDWVKNSKEEAHAKWEYIVHGEPKNKKELLGDRKTPLPLPNFRAVKMEDARFSDLKFHIGAKYLFCHQGDCKHEVVVRDMRLVHPEDHQNRTSYPLVVYQHKPSIHKCGACLIFKAEYVTSNDIMAPEQPFYWCSGCYYLIHYDKGILRYDHTVHELIQDV